GGGEGEIGVCDVENTVFVAVGKNVKESKSTLFWALQSFAGKKICLLHVHDPAHSITLVNGKTSGTILKHQAVVCRELDRKRMHNLLNQYFLTLAQVGVQADKVCLENDNVEKGIVQIIAQHNIRWFVMGAVADKHYTKKLSELRSRKANFVCQQAPVSCNIWFVCNGCLIYSRARDGNLISHVESITKCPSSPSNWRTKLLQSHAEANEDVDERDGISRQFASQVLVQSIKSTDKVVVTLEPNALSINEMRGDGSPLSSLLQGRLDHPSSVVLLEGNSNGEATSEICDKLEHAMIDANSSRHKAFEESVTRRKAEEDAIELVPEAEALENSCMKDAKEIKEMEEVLARQKEELERMKNQHDQCTKELLMIRDQNRVLECQLMESRSVEEELEEKIIQAVNLLITFREKRDKLRIEHSKTIRQINGLKKMVKRDAADLCKLQFFAFSFWEINEATRDFNPSWKIGDGRYGSVYKGLLRHLKVAIKMLPSNCSQGHVEFEQEAWALSKVRHPNIVNLIGTCPESSSLIYEYISNGSLEDQLARKGKTPPLPWKTRAKIASEICSALVFLHSSKPSIIHGNLKPTNILLDSNFVIKLSDFCIYRLIPHNKNTTYNTKLSDKTDLEDSIYVDPEFFETGELSVESDVYSYGIVLLRLLTGRPALGIVKDVKCALERDNFSSVLDFGAGEWPFEQAKTLARLALRCCEHKRENRPNFMSDLWAEIEKMKELCTSNQDSKGPRRVPSHFVCPIFQEVMKDPHIAADGFTYEGDAIRGWLNSGHKTSPMTNLELDHCDLLPNNALYYAIQEWQQRP
ncbi:hypothetical protein U1Q18_004592, partial [Sarracenia purpurea var. burkii]